MAAAIEKPQNYRKECDAGHLEQVKCAIMELFGGYFNEVSTDFPQRNSEMVNKMLDELRDVLWGTQVWNSQKLSGFPLNKDLTPRTQRPKNTKPRLKVVYRSDSLIARGIMKPSRIDDDGKELLGAEGWRDKPIPYPYGHLPIRIEVEYNNAANLFIVLAHECGHFVSELVTTLRNQHTSQDALTYKKGDPWRIHLLERISIYFQQLATEWLIKHSEYWDKFGVSAEQVSMAVNHTRMELLLPLLASLGVAKKYSNLKATFHVPYDRQQWAAWHDYPLSPESVARPETTSGSTEWIIHELLEWPGRGRTTSTVMDRAWGTSAWDTRTKQAARELTHSVRNMGGHLLQRLEGILNKPIFGRGAEPEIRTRSGNLVPVSTVTYSFGGGMKQGDEDGNGGPVLIVERLRKYCNERKKDGSPKPRTQEYEEVMDGDVWHREQEALPIFGDYTMAAVEAYRVSQKQVSNWDKVIELIYRPASEYNADLFQEWMNYWANVGRTVTE
jgi:hypothetical protein